MLVNGTVTDIPPNTDIWTGCFPELLIDIFKLCGYKGTVTCSKVCKTWNQLITNAEKQLWKHHFLSDFNPFAPSDTKYFNEYKHLTQKKKQWNGHDNCSYAIGNWDDSGNIPTQHNKFVIVNEQLLIKNFVLPKNDAIEQILNVLKIYNKFEDGNTDCPSQIKDKCWKQASIPKSLFYRFTLITEFSGKFMIFIDKTKIADYWDAFIGPYQLGMLGYALKSSTAKTSPHASGPNISLLSIHTENAFDLKEISRVAWEIHKILLSLDAASQTGFVYLMDQSTMFKTSHADAELSSTLYQFVSRHFYTPVVVPATGSIEYVEKSLSLYSKHFFMNNEAKATERQELLANDKAKRNAKRNTPTPFNFSNG